MRVHLAALALASTLVPVTKSTNTECMDTGPPAGREQVPFDTGKFGTTACELLPLSQLVAADRRRPETIKSYRCLEEELDTKARTLTVQHLELDAPTLEAEEWLCRSGGDEALGIESRTSRDQHGGVPGQGSYPPKCNVNVREAVSYMPEPAHLAAMQNAAGRNPDRATQALIGEISAMLNTEDCSRAVAAPLPAYGFAATFHYAVLQLGRALKSSLAISFTGYFSYAPVECAERSLECVMQPASHTCPPLFAEADVSDAADKQTLAHGWFGESERARQLDTGIEAVQDGMFACCGTRHHSAVDCEQRYDMYSQEIHERCGEADPRWVPPSFAAGKGSFWFRSVLAGYLFAPLPAYMDRFRKLEGQLRGPGPEETKRTVTGAKGQPGVIGVHIRRGDACHVSPGWDHNQHCVDTAQYIQAIIEMATRYPHMRRIFLATNAGLAVVRRVQDGVAPHGLEVVIQDISDRAKYACCEDEEAINCSRAPGCRRTDRLLMAKVRDAGFDEEIVTDILGLASSDALIGTMTSQVLRLALELSYFWRGHLVPYRSLDIPWCWQGFRRAPFIVGDRTFEYGC